MQENPRLKSCRLAIARHPELYDAWQGARGNPGGWAKGALLWCREGMTRALDGLPTAVASGQSAGKLRAYSLGHELGLSLLRTELGQLLEELESLHINLLATMQADAFVWVWFFGYRETVYGGTVLPSWGRPGPNPDPGAD